MRTLSALTRHKTRLDSFFRRDGTNLPTVDELDAAWEGCLVALEKALHFVQHNCHVDALERMPSPYVLIPLVAFYAKNSSNVVTVQHTKSLEQWFYRVTLWSRYSTSTETKLDQDLKAIYSSDAVNDQIQGLKDAVDSATGKRMVTAGDIRNRTNSPFLLLMRILAARRQAKDWKSGIAFSADQQIKARPLFTEKYITGSEKKWRVQDIANYVLTVSDLDAAKSPSEILSGLAPIHLQDQQIPTDPALWQPEKYDEFLLARRQILSQQANLLMYEELPALPTDVLFQRIMALEAQLREIIATQLHQNESSLAWEKLVPRDIQNRVEKLIQQKNGNNAAYRDAFENLEAHLRQCLFSDLGKIMESNWTLFKEAFGAYPVFDQQFHYVLKARNSCAHNAIVELSDAERMHAQASLEWFDDCLSIQHDAMLET